MAISRMNMERQMRNMGGIMGLEDQRQGYFLGKLVKKVAKGVKKVVKSPLGKMALLAGGAYFAGGGGLPQFLGGKGLGGFGSNAFGRGITSLLGKGKGLFDKGNLLAGLVRNPETGKFSLGRAALSGLGAASIAAPFLMGGDEEVDEGTPFTSPQADIEDIRGQAKAYYSDPTNSALYFMPPKSAVRSSFYAAEGGLASLPRDGYRFGNMVQKAGQMMKAGVGKVKSLFDDADISIQVRDEDVMTDYGPQAQAVGQDVFIAPKSKKAVKVMEDLIEEGYDITRDPEGEYIINALDEGALEIIAKRLRLGGKDIDDFMGSYDDYYSGGDDKMIFDALRNRKAEGGLTDIPREGYESGERVTGILKLLSMLTPMGAAKKAGESIANMDADTLKKISMFTPMGAAKKAGESIAGMDMDILKRLSMFTPSGAAVQLGKTLAMKDGGMIDMGGLEKDYREGGFVPLGAEERADDVPARLSKNEFVFTADAVRNAGGGDIDKGAEVMQNMMDNLESGGSISEESQGMENPAQEMFDQAQMLENRIE